MDTEPVQLPRPIVIKVRKKHKRRYSRGLGDLQRVARGFSKLNSRAASAYASGFASFYKSSNKSSFKKRDGALRDFSRNLGKAASKSLRKGSRLPADAAVILSTGSARRAIRRQIQVISFINRRFGLR